MSQRVVVVGGGLAGIVAALDCAEAGAEVTLLERRHRLGGLTWSFRHRGMWVDNGQHVFLRCCNEYLGFLARIGAAGDVELQERLDVPVLAPGPRGPLSGRLRRSGWPPRLPAPLHLAPSLLAYPHLSPTERLAAGRALLPLRRLDLSDPMLDRQSFGAWLARHGQSEAAVSALWGLVTTATVNLPPAEASLAVAAMVFQTGLLKDPAAADIGWSRVPLGVLHGERAAKALARAGVEVRTGTRVLSVSRIGKVPAPRFSVEAEGLSLDAQAVVVAVPHHLLSGLLPPGAISLEERLAGLGTSAIVNIHLVFDRRVTDEAFFAGVGTPLQWVFDRTGSSGLAEAGSPGPQYLAVSISAADALLGRRPEELCRWAASHLSELLPGCRGARLLDGLVTKERAATFRAAPGTAPLRLGPATSFRGLALAGAWTATGWPATMEGAVRSGRAAAACVLDALEGTSSAPGAAEAPGHLPAPAGRPDAQSPYQQTQDDEEVA